MKQTHTHLLSGIENLIPDFCDDGNLINGDGCSATCSVECGFDCIRGPEVTDKGGSALPTYEQDSCSSTCGDGIMAADELCDDGNLELGDGCDTAGGCRLEDGWICSADASCTTICSGRCGDGQRKGHNERAGQLGYCDDNNTLSNDGCSSECSVECGWNCSTSNASSADDCTTSCGDGMFAGAELCDDSNIEDGDGCSSSCTVEEGWRCFNTGCQISQCLMPICGDGRKWGNELVQSNACDDGNTAPDDGCSADCVVECGFICAGATLDSADSCSTSCGDGLLAGLEICDDNNTVGGDGCSADCLSIEHGWECSTDQCQPSVCTEPCGNGLVSVNEECDNGDSLSGDGCSSTCTVECGFDCGTAEPSACTSSCGDGAQALDEACEDGNTANGDGCSSVCIPRVQAGSASLQTRAARPHANRCAEMASSLERRDV